MRLSKKVFDAFVGGFFGVTPGGMEIFRQLWSAAVDQRGGAAAFAEEIFHSAALPAQEVLGSAFVCGPWCGVGQGDVNGCDAVGENTRVMATTPHRHAGHVTC